jgi:hypothetical protein
MTRPNPITSLDAGGALCLHIGRPWPGASEFLRWAQPKPAPIAVQL